MDQGRQGSIAVAVDTNIVVESLLLPDGKIAGHLKESTLLAPNFLLIELGNVLRKYHHSENLKEDDVLEYMVCTRDLIRHWIPDNVLLNRAMNLSMSFNHAIYGYLFLALSELHAVPFWTLDCKLKLKAKSLGIQTIE